jgi:hypothetical protein
LCPKNAETFIVRPVFVGRFGITVKTSRPHIPRILDELALATIAAFQAFPSALVTN